MHQVLFWMGIATLAMLMISMFPEKSDERGVMKREFIALPFLLFFASAVAKYIGL